MPLPMLGRWFLQPGWQSTTRSLTCFRRILYLPLIPAIIRSLLWFHIPCRRMPTSCRRTVRPLWTNTCREIVVVGRYALALAAVAASSGDWWFSSGVIRSFSCYRVMPAWCARTVFRTCRNEQFPPGGGGGGELIKDVYNDLCVTVTFWWCLWLFYVLIYFDVASLQLVSCCPAPFLGAPVFFSSCCIYVSGLIQAFLFYLWVLCCVLCLFASSGGRLDRVFSGWPPCVGYFRKF